jgi:hypothetical protein
MVVPPWRHALPARSTVYARLDRAPNGGNSAGSNALKSEARGWMTAARSGLREA